MKNISIVLPMFMISLQLSITKAESQVEAGQPIVKIDNTGSSQGAHLHFEIRINGSPVDPLPYLMAFGPTIQDGDVRDDI